ncbi:FAD-binding oxidoreductase [Streptomyces sp. S1A]|uniref:nitric oxide dioxygenase n=1 Tax=Streptomyces chitinivorans TaxID=1257027 RepID=A0ABW7HUX6_9ACTN|nr:MULTISPECIES: globin domain-containing protein [Streptomyces]MCG3040359.1 FAD-binding oxidoreductase [Streptomyces sp. ICN903]MDH2408640.1 FAD-binding oxidoreductase [Streptomyces chitinivorans]
MLSEKSTAVVRATLPAIGAAIGDITPVFYRRMFAAHPELLRDLFNRGNQANGTQSRALAGSIAVFATMLLEHPDRRPDAMLARIAHKHAALGITADQYTIVHRHLFDAIAEVLGEAVTPEVAEAWDEVYWLMAGALIAMEARLYAASGLGDGDVWRPWKVVGRTEETAEVATFVLRPADGGPVPPFRPGQYVSVQVALPDGARQIRQYSLSCAPDGDDRRISVKRVGGDPAGEVSNRLHENVREGDVLTVGAPFGDVALDDGDDPVLLASAGIGCTPMVSMLAHLAATGSPRRTTVVHGDRTESSHAFREQTEQLTAKLPDAALHVWYERPEGEWPAERTGLVDLSGVEIPEGVRAYLCGPVPFMRSVRTQLLERGVPASRIHYESFGPDLGLDVG